MDEETTVPAGPAPWRRWLPRLAMGVGGAVAAGFLALVVRALG